MKKKLLIGVCVAALAATACAAYLYKPREEMRVLSIQEQSAVEYTRALIGRDFESIASLTRLPYEGVPADRIESWMWTFGVDAPEGLDFDAELDAFLGHDRNARVAVESKKNEDDDYTFVKVKMFDEEGDSTDVSVNVTDTGIVVPDGLIKIPEIGTPVQDVTLWGIPVETSLAEGSDSPFKYHTNEMIWFDMETQYYIEGIPAQLISDETDIYLLADNSDETVLGIKQDLRTALNQMLTCAHFSEGIIATPIETVDEDEEADYYKKLNKEEKLEYDKAKALEEEAKALELQQNKERALELADEIYEICKMDLDSKQGFMDSTDHTTQYLQDFKVEGLEDLTRISEDSYIGTAKVVAVIKGDTLGTEEAKLLMEFKVDLSETGVVETISIPASSFEGIKGISRFTQQW